MLKKVALLLLFFPIAVYASEYLFMPLPEIITDVDPGKADLGKQLFYDSILSRENTIACSSCHNPKNYGVDNLKVSVGISGKKPSRNTPSIWNVRYNFVQTWDGRNRTLFDQTVHALENPFEMDEKMANIVDKLKHSGQYEPIFIQMYPDGLTEKNVADALVNFLKTLITPDSRFDRYLQGEEDLFNNKEVAGYKLFQSKGCVACHNGINLGANLYQKLGIFDDRKVKKMNDYGRYLITGNIKDKYFFKVPSLRNIEKTAPYLHDGSIKSLHKVVKTMGELQLGQQLKDDEIDRIVAFLKTLTGKIPQSALIRPTNNEQQIQK